MFRAWTTPWPWFTMAGILCQTLDSSLWEGRGGRGVQIREWWWWFFLRERTREWAREKKRKETHLFFLSSSSSSPFTLWTTTKPTTVPARVPLDLPLGVAREVGGAAGGRHVFFFFFLFFKTRRQRRALELFKLVCSLWHSLPLSLLPHKQNKTGSYAGKY